jgi:hypothetical protein
MGEMAYPHEMICPILEEVWCTIKIDMLVKAIGTERAARLARG